MTPTLLVTTVDSPETARTLARAAVERRLAACVQITPIESVYAWQGAIEQGPEWRLLFKTTADRVPALESYLVGSRPAAGRDGLGAWPGPLRVDADLAGPAAAFRCHGEGAVAHDGAVFTPPPEMHPMPARPHTELQIVPGELVVLFIVQIARAVSTLALPPGRFLEGLRAAVDLLGFAELVRDEERLDELLPWAGNV
ncbi:MAG: divalent-cation tolerance protein CutA [Ideonella sp.]|nr:divalent-cation tolerance protein CutA [Ideonella sp.]